MIPWNTGWATNGIHKRDPYFIDETFRVNKIEGKQPAFQAMVDSLHAGDKVDMSRMREQTSLNGKKHHYLAQAMIERP